ncbi:helix-turn-helix domain-containing protein [Rickettsiales bacterium LUAb2]
MSQNENSQLTVGDILKKTRIENGLSIADIVTYTRIRYAHIEAIENNQYTKLPEKTYALGYVVAYAKFLKLDHKLILKNAEQEYKVFDPNYEKMIQNIRLDKQYNPIRIIRNNIIDFFLILLTLGKYKISEEDLNSKKENTTKNNNTVLYTSILLVCAIIIIVLIGGYYFAYKKPTISVNESPIEINSKIANSLDLGNTKNDPEDKKINKIINQDSVIVIDKADAKASNVQNNDDVLKQNANAPAQNPESKIITPWPNTKADSVITLTFTDKVWVTIYDAKDNSKVYLDAIYNPGSTFRVPNVDNLRMNIGNYHGLVINANGKDIQLTSNRNSNVLNNIILNASSLISTYVTK